MKYIVLLGLSFILFSCKTQKSGCDAYSKTQKSDTTYITSNHYHIESQYKCVWVDTTKK